MKVLVCIDDTDNLDSLGTGELSTMIAQAMERRGWGKSFGTTRHQLLVHPDIPYTSHNSSMCFAADVQESFLKELIDFAGNFLDEHSAPGSDPGLCVVVPERLSKPDQLIAFGRKAKDSILTKQDAYRLAEELGVHLSEHGGTGQGVIGALAGAGLRLSGNDGRFKGKLHIESETNTASVREICSKTSVEAVKSMDGTVLEPDDLVYLGEKLKAVLLDNQCVLLVNPVEDGNAGGAKWQTCTKQQLRAY